MIPDVFIVKYVYHESDDSTFCSIKINDEIVKGLVSSGKTKQEAKKDMIRILSRKALEQYYRNIHERKTERDLYHKKKQQNETN
jgi:hypothetical protein